MPNWCDNSVIFYNHDKTKIDALETEMSKKDERGYYIAQPFNFLRPRPADQEENWYEWNVNNWGTKWDASVGDWERQDDNNIHLIFDSAWSPPVTLYEYLTEQGWDIEAYYNEPGMCFVGKYTSVDGDEYYEYDIEDINTINCIPEDIVDYAGLIDNYEMYKEEQEREDL